MVNASAMTHGKCRIAYDPCPGGGIGVAANGLVQSNGAEAFHGNFGEDQFVCCGSVFGDNRSDGPRGGWFSRGLFDGGGDGCRFLRSDRIRQGRLQCNRFLDDGLVTKGCADGLFRGRSCWDRGVRRGRCNVGWLGCCRQGNRRLCNVGLCNRWFLCRSGGDGLLFS